jgi:hypothetical protein
MENEKLSSREAAIIAQARREAEALKRATAAAPPAAAPEQERARTGKPDLVERMAQLMAEERAETARRKKKMRRYGLIGSAAILAAFALWLVSVLSRRR